MIGPGEQRPQAARLFLDARGVDRDLVLVNRALHPVHGHIVLAQVDNDFTVKYLNLRRGRPELVAVNPTFPTVQLADSQQLVVCGVVTTAIKRFV